MFARCIEPLGSFDFDACTERATIYAPLDLDDELRTPRNTVRSLYYKYTIRFVKNFKNVCLFAAVE